MPRRPRNDEPGSWHHVAHPGIAKRPLFETRDDTRFFLSRIAREVRNGRIEVHSFCVLTTHFHFLVKSSQGEMSSAFRRAQNAHSRRFNRLRRRDGALVRGRFFSRPVEDDRYRRTLVRSIDQSPVRARIVRASSEYEFGSARHEALPSGPVWFERRWVEKEARRLADASAFTPAIHARAFAKGDVGHLAELVERRWKSRSEFEPLNDLVTTTPRSVRLWMERKARFADGHRPGSPIWTIGALRDALGADESREGEWVVEVDERPKRGRAIAEVGLSHDLAGLAWRGR